MANIGRDKIREVFLANGFTIKEGNTDLKEYVYNAAKALLALVNTPAEPLDPLDTPLPCDLTAGGVTIGKGCPLRTVQLRLQVQAEGNALLMRNIREANTKAPATGGLKDHEVAQLVNRLRKIAVTFHETGQLRERIASEIRPLAHALAAPAEQDSAEKANEREALIKQMKEALETCHISGYVDVDNDWQQTKHFDTNAVKAARDAADAYFESKKG